MNYKKYKPYHKFKFKERTWPDKVTISAPIWRSVDLRDENQALPTPMGIEEKVNLYKTLVKIGLEKYNVTFYNEHAREEGENSQAITYIQPEQKREGKKYFGVGISPNIGVFNKNEY